MAQHRRCQFHYSRDRGGEHPEKHLASYSGLMQADAYSGYNRLYGEGCKPGMIFEAACWAHGRRKFFELADLQKAPLTIEPEGYRFSHKSFYEFFCARAFAFNSEKYSTQFSTRYFSYEVLRFLGELAGLKPDFHSLCEKRLSSTSGHLSERIARSNALGVLLCGLTDPKPASADGVTIDGIEYR